MTAEADGRTIEVPRGWRAHLAAISHLRLWRSLANSKKGGSLFRVPWLFALPGVFFLLSFRIVPAAVGSGYAFTNWTGIGPLHFIGFQNFRHIVHDPETLGALLHTLELAGAFFITVNLAGLGLALGLNRTLKTRNALRSIFFAPVVMSPLAVSFVWQYIFAYRGVLNQILGFFGLEGWEHAWVGDPNWALWTILTVLVWQFSGLMMVIYLAGLQAIPDELTEAAQVDGGTAWKNFRHITLPLLAPAITVCMTLALIIGLRTFEQVLALTGGGPINDTQTLATEVWEQAWTYGNFGLGSALALILTALVTLLATLQLIVLRTREKRI